MTNSNESHILNRLKHPEREEQRLKKERKMLFFRNILNAVFMLLAAVTMVGIWAFPDYTNHWYIIGLVAVCIKIVEVMFRMPGMKNNKK